MKFKVGDKVRARGNWGTTENGKPVEATILRLDVNGRVEYSRHLASADTGARDFAYAGQLELVPSPAPIGLDKPEAPHVPIGANGMENKHVDVPPPEPTLLGVGGFRVGDLVITPSGAKGSVAILTSSGYVGVRTTDGMDGEFLPSRLNKQEAPAPVEGILQEALRITDGARARDYGSAKTNHERIALFWKVWDTCAMSSDEDIDALLNVVEKQTANNPSDNRASGVAMKMILMKIARHANTPKRDNLVDIAGYARCLSRINGFEE